MTAARFVVFVVMAAALLVGCTRYMYRAPPRDAAGQATAPQAAAGPGQPAGAVEAVQKSPGIVSVQAGDTVFGISRRYGLPVRAVIDANALSPPYILNVGQRLVVPVAPVHVVQQGDTVYGIARRYDVGVSELVRVNHVAPPYVIVPGQKLLLPGAQAVALANPAPTGTIPPTVAVSGTAPTSTRIETAPLAPVPVTAETNPSPVAPAPVALEVTTEQPATARPAGPKTVLPSRKPVLAAASPAIAPSGSKAPAKPAVKPKRPVGAPPQLSAGGFRWPVNGRVLVRFGAKQGGLRNDGINIGAPRGTSVRAAQSGVVAYSGNELRGFGNLLLVKHAGGWTSAYAHADTLLVRRGDIVQIGQVIARVGTTGNVDRPQLHFELRKGTSAEDPLKYLGTSKQISRAPAL